MTMPLNIRVSQSCLTAFKSTDTPITFLGSQASGTTCIHHRYLHHLLPLQDFSLAYISKSPPFGQDHLRHVTISRTSSVSGRTIGLQAPTGGALRRWIFQADRGITERRRPSGHSDLLLVIGEESSRTYAYELERCKWYMTIPLDWRLMIRDHS
jgi:hypothetical protein